MTSGNKFDAIVVGGGHNGLVSSAYLAKSGLRILLLEASDRIGGASATSEFFEGFSVSECAHLLYCLHPTIVQELDLNNHGLVYAATNLSTVALGSDGKHINIKSNSLSGAISDDDARHYREFHSLMTKFCKVLGATLQHCRT